jgi:myo-inositol-1(or 4)-monophosphatase
VLLGLEIENRVVAGAAYFPALDEMVAAAEGTGCFLNGRRCRVGSVESISRAVVSFTNAANFKLAGREAAWQRVVDAAYHSVGWSDAYGHALVATGRLDLMLDPIMNDYDCGPFPVILREAGGFFGDWSGTETIHAGEALSTSRGLLPDVLQLIGPKDDRV